MNRLFGIKTQNPTAAVHSDERQLHNTNLSNAQSAVPLDEKSPGTGWGKKPP